MACPLREFLSNLAVHGFVLPACGTSLNQDWHAVI